jgi:hypothetical protein
MRKSQEAEIKVTLTPLTPWETDILVEFIAETLLKAIIAEQSENGQRQETIRKTEVGHKDI